VWRWKERSAETRKLYARAREDQMHAFADELLEIADDGANDFVERKDKAGLVTTAYDREHVDRSKLRVDARKWLMARLAPRDYGDRLDLTDGVTTPISQALAKARKRAAAASA
jgi:hypothetical protein